MKLNRFNRLFISGNYVFKLCLCFINFFCRLLMMAEGKHNLHMRYAEEFNKHAEIFLDSSNTS